MGTLSQTYLLCQDHRAYSEVKESRRLGFRQPIVGHSLRRRWLLPLYNELG